nr:class I SAM-dependent methyltransferase [Rhizobium sp. Q54]
MCGFCQVILKSVGRVIVNKGCSAPPFRAMRERIIPTAYGDVLEVGVGSGHNLDLYDRERTKTLVGVDPDAKILALARRRADDLQRHVRLLEGTAEDLPIETSSVDTVVASYLLCTVVDPERALSEMRRVLRPEGRLIFLEHGASHGRLLPRIQSRVNGAWKLVAGGCNLTREPLAALARSGFHVELLADEEFGGRMRFLGSHVGGIARRATA